MTDLDELRRLQRDGSDELGWLLDLCLRWVREGRLTLACPRAVQRAWTRLQDERAELERLRSRVAELGAKLAEAREVVRPFAEVAELVETDDWPGDRTSLSSHTGAARYGHCKRAADWLRKQEE